MIYFCQSSLIKEIEHNDKDTVCLPRQDIKKKLIFVAAQQILICSIPWFTHNLHTLRLIWQKWRVYSRRFFILEYMLIFPVFQQVQEDIYSVPAGSAIPRSPAATELSVFCKS